MFFGCTSDVVRRYFGWVLLGVVLSLRAYIVRIAIRIARRGVVAQVPQAPSAVGSPLPSQGGNPIPRATSQANEYSAFRSDRYAITSLLRSGNISSFRSDRCAITSLLPCFAAIIKLFPSSFKYILCSEIKLF